MSTKTIVITRPSGQARQLIEVLTQAIEKSGVAQRSLPEILSLPLLTIIPKDDEQLADHIASSLKDADLAIFVSPNAIESVMRLLERDWEELQELKWDWSTKKIIIFKGEGGRDWLADTLKQAGATVEAISTYTRVPLSIDNPAWHAIQVMDFSKSLWVLTSSEAARYLGSITKEQLTQSLQSAAALCPHHNIADAARAIGFGDVFTTESGDTALIKATLAWLTIQ